MAKVPLQLIAMIQPPGQLVNDQDTTVTGMGRRKPRQTGENKMAFDQHEIETASLASLGVILLDSVDAATEAGEYEEIEAAYKTIGQEVIRRVPDATKLRHLMDFHYKKWSDLQVQGTNNELPKETALNNSYLEFRAMMTGFVEANSTEEVFDVSN